MIQHVRFLCWYVWCSSFSVIQPLTNRKMNVEQLFKQVSHLTWNILRRQKHEPCYGIYSSMGVLSWFWHLRNINLWIKGRIKDGSATQLISITNMNDSIDDLPKHPKHPTSQRWLSLDSSTSQWQFVHYAPAHVQRFCLKNPSTAVNQKKGLWWSRRKHQEN